MRFQAKPYRVDDALALERSGLSRPFAAILARRGLGSPEAADQFLAAEEAHDPFEFEGMDRVVAMVSQAIADRRPITVYGDFDCDGVCATSILVAAIRGLGGACDWFIPDRISEGYGLNAEAIRRIAERGTALVITVDCGVTAVDEVALARELGMEIVVTDHHQPDPALPDCPILHPEVSGYPFPKLCGAAVAAKLASALRRSSGADPSGDEADLDLVALATVADVMPLEGENRRLVAEGVKVARRARRTGLAALMEDARVEPTRLASEDFGFRLGPRINAAGRMYRADAGVELMLAESRERAAEIARELSGANAERRRVEREVESDAKAQLREQGQPGPALVVAGEGWHPGVVGIVASHLARSEGRPAVVISLEGEKGRGSARSVPGLDLHAALAEVSELLDTFGGHAAAAGLSIGRDRIPEFRAALGRAVESRIGADPIEPYESFDAVAGGGDLGLDLAEEIDRLEPFGNGNPAVKLLVPGAEVEDLRQMGEDGRHCRFTVRSGSHRANAVCWGKADLGLDPGQRADLVAEFGINHWNGSIEPRLVVRGVRALPESEPLAACGPAEWWERFEAAFSAPLAEREGSMAAFELELESARLPGVAIGELISSGERICVLTPDACRRWRSLGGAEGLSRFLPEAGPEPRRAVTGIWAGSPASEIGRAGEAQVLLAEYECLDAVPAPDLTGFDRIAILDPPLVPEAVAAVSATGLPTHFLAGAPEFEFAERVAAERGDLTSALRGVYAGLRDAGAIDDGTGLAGETLRAILSGGPESPRSPEAAAALLRVLVEASLARTEGRSDARLAGVLSSERTELSVSAVFVHHSDLHKEQVRFLTQSRRQIPKP